MVRFHSCLFLELSMYQMAAQGELLLLQAELKGIFPFALIGSQAARTVVAELCAVLSDFICVRIQENVWTFLSVALELSWGQHQDSWIW